MSEFRDLSAYGINAQDQLEWLEVKEGYQDIPGFPEVLLDKTKPVIVLNLEEKHEPVTQKSMFRGLMGKIDGAFTSGLVTKESEAKREKFSEAFDTTTQSNEQTFVFERTKIFHLPEEQYELTIEPTESAWGRLRLHDTPPDETIKMFEIDSITEDTEIVIIPPPQADIDPYAKAVFEEFGKVPHVAFWTVTRFASGVSWTVSEFMPEMPNLMAMENGAL